MGYSVVDLGEGTLCPLLFLDQTEAQRAKKIFGGDRASLI